MEDERRVEMDCISAIFPEMVTDPQDPFSASIELPVQPGTSVKVVFPASADGPTLILPSPSLSDRSDEDGRPAPHPAHNVESHILSHLPPLHLHITLPEGYPSARAPKFELSTVPAWLPRSYLDELQDTGGRMWEEGGHTEVVYGYIDFLQQAAEKAFGHLDAKTLEVPQEFKIALLDHNIKATQAAFDKETFVCGVCLGKMRHGKRSGLPNFFQIQRRVRLATACSTAVMYSVCSASRTSTTMRLPRATWPQCAV
jgi:E3 ubiquitin-protein ligase RNF14